MSNTVTRIEPDYADSLEAQLIVDYVASGMTLVDACRTLGITIFVVYGHIRRSDRFRAMMEEARECGFDVIAARVRYLAAGVVENPEDPFLVAASKDPKRARLMVDTDLKLLAKWHPKKYGEKLQVETKGATVTIPVGNDPVEAQKAYEQMMRT